MPSHEKPAASAFHASSTAAATVVGKVTMPNRISAPCSKSMPATIMSCLRSRNLLPAPRPGTWDLVGSLRQEALPMSDYREIVFETRDPVALIRLNRPEKLNALTYTMLAEIRHAVDTAAQDPRVVGIVVTGAGRGFCAGLDARALADVTTSGRP